MKCPNCGEELKQGYLYCEKCGGEIHIVPDFEPEIENSIIETLSAVAEDVSPNEAEAEDSLQEEFGDDSPGKGMVIALSLLFVCAVGFLVFYFTRPAYKEESLQTKLSKAQMAYNNNEYSDAADLYENVLSLYFFL